MRNGKRIGVVIPALNEEQAVGRVVSDIPSWVDDIVVADNGSHDCTAAAARAAGARVVVEHERGYGAACQAGIATLRAPDIIVFLDGDYSDRPQEMAALVDPIASGSADFVVGSRVRGDRERGALTPQQRFGNWLACRLIRRVSGTTCSDLGPFRAIRADALRSLDVKDRAFGWTVEMQIRAIEAALHVIEVPVSYRCRIGQSKVSGTVSGTVRAGTKILWIIARHALRRRRNSSRAAATSQRGVAL